MAKIKVFSKAPVVDGLSLTFKAPCDCTEIDGLIVGSQTFAFQDAHRNNLAGLGNLFLAGACVNVILDTVNGYAYIQNAGTNSYLESRISSKQNQLGWLTEADIDAMFAGTYVGVEDESPEAVVATYDGSFTTEVL